MLHNLIRLAITKLTRTAQGTSHQRSTRTVATHPPAALPARHEHCTSPLPVHAPESERTGTHSFQTSRAPENVFAACSATTRTGSPCLASPRKHSAFCIYHDPAYREAQRANSAAGGRAAASARERQAKEVAALAWADPGERSYLLGALLDAQIRDAIPPARARTALATLTALDRLERRFGV